MVADEFAASGPARPSIAPVPNFLRLRATDCSIRYEAKVDNAAEGPGKMPKPKPIGEPRSHAGRASRNSRLVGMRSRRRIFIGPAFCLLPLNINTNSEIP